MSKRTPSTEDMWAQQALKKREKPKKKAWFSKCFQTAEEKKATVNMTTGQKIESGQKDKATANMTRKKIPYDYEGQQKYLQEERESKERFEERIPFLTFPPDERERAIKKYEERKNRRRIASQRAKDAKNPQEGK